MKKIFSSIFIASLLALNLSTTTLAVDMSETEASTQDPAEILANSVDISFTFSPQNLSDTLFGYYSDLVDSEVTGYSYYADEETDEEAALEDEHYLTIREALKNNPFTVAIDFEEKTEEEDDAEEELDIYYSDFPTFHTYGLIPMSENTYSDLLDTVLAYEELTDWELSEEDRVTDPISHYATVVDSLSVYSNPFDSGYFSYLNGYYIMTDSVEDFEVMMDQEESLSADSSYSNILSYLDTENILEFYFADLEASLSDLIYLYGDASTSLASIIAEGLSIRQSDEGFHLKVKAETTESTDSIEDITLHNYLHGDDVIYFADSVSTPGFSDSLFLDPFYSEVRDEIFYEFSVDLDLLLEGLEREVALIVTDSGSLIPNFQALSLLPEDYSGFETELETTLDGLWKELTLESDDNSDNVLVYLDSDFTTSITRSESDGLTTYAIETEYNEKENPYALSLPSELLDISFTVGIIDGMFIVTNDEYAPTEGIENIEVQSMLTEDVNSIAYFDFQNLKNYINGAVSVIQEVDPDEFDDIENFKKAMDIIFEPFGYISASGNVTPSSVEGNLDFIFDLDAVIALYDNQELDDLLDSSSSSGSSLEKLQDPPEDLDDVSSEDWFSDDVYYLNSEGIVNGYSDNTYKPAQAVTRAEFLKLVLESLEENGHIYVSESGYSDFDDVHYYGYYDEDSFWVSGDWHAEYIDTAIRLELAGGYANNTFLPGNNITRAEAASIISNVIDKYAVVEVESVTPNADDIFTDVKESDWFEGVIANVYNYGVMTGITNDQFFPYKELNRAEAAALIRNLLEVI
jgi:hypothetical protein